MPVIPLSARLWAIFCHLSVVILIPLLLLFFNIPSISGVNGGCAFKPMRGCDENARLILLLEHCVKLILLWSLPFSSVIVSTIILQTKGRTHLFINSHAKEALKFQFKLAGCIAIIHLILSTLLALFDHTLGFVILIVLFDYLFFPAMAIVQILLGIVAAVQALRGRSAHYPEINLLVIDK